MPGNMINPEWEKYLATHGEEINDLIYTENPYKTQSFAYDTNSPIPGETVDYDDKITKGEIDETTALDDLITKSAIAKAANENKVINSIKEQQRIKAQIIDAIFYNEEQAFYQKHRHMMDGKTKRRVKRIIEKNYNAGKYDYLKTTSNLNEP